ncbi:TrbC/VirB2 family protein [Luteibacter anthropi]|uniref:TrbC/VirB2 family protein n=1 Tax=Luteibacter anthropi TaxID=564369 RepID=UPI0020330EE7|nr:TrbC/VirB2 family protein [Luteibacter anthropi]URX62673.1 TrbC/VirB2 family protein [Luteibacter anthropi]
MAKPSFNPTIDKSSADLSRKIAFAFIVIAMLLPTVAFGFVDGGDSTQTSTKVCGFFENINGLLNAASIVVVTIAVIFSGYQIAFAHKRIADVAPALIGGVLIGAAAQVASMVVGGSGSASKACDATSGKVMGLLIDAASTIQHLLPFHA